MQKLHTIYSKIYFSGARGYLQIRNCKDSRHEEYLKYLYFIRICFLKLKFQKYPHPPFHIVVYRCPLTNPLKYALEIHTFRFCQKVKI